MGVRLMHEYSKDLLNEVKLKFYTNTEKRKELTEKLCSDYFRNNKEDYLLYYSTSFLLMIMAFLFIVFDIVIHQVGMNSQMVKELGFLVCITIVLAFLQSYGKKLGNDKILQLYHILNNEALTFDKEYFILYATNDNYKIEYLYWFFYENVKKIEYDTKNKLLRVFGKFEYREYINNDNRAVINATTEDTSYVIIPEYYNDFEGIKECLNKFTKCEILAI